MMADPAFRKSVKCKILGFTSNLISSGIREVIRFLVEHRMSVIWSLSKLIARLGKEIKDESSYLYWAHKVHCDATIAFLLLVAATFATRLHKKD